MTVGSATTKNKDKTGAPAEKETIPMPNEISKQPRAILYTSPARGEPSTEEQETQLAAFAEARGFELGPTFTFKAPIPGRMMVSPEGLTHLADTFDFVLYVEHGKPVACPVRPGNVRN